PARNFGKLRDEGSTASGQRTKTRASRRRPQELIIENQSSRPAALNRRIFTPDGWNLSPDGLGGLATKESRLADAAVATASSSTLSVRSVKSEANIRSVWPFQRTSTRLDSDGPTKSIRLSSGTETSVRCPASSIPQHDVSRVNKKRCDISSAPSIEPQNK